MRHEECVARYFATILDKFEAGGANLDGDPAICAIYRGLARGVRRSDLATFFIMRKDPEATNGHVFHLEAAMLARTAWDAADETGGIVPYDKSSDFWRDSWKVNTHGDPMLPWKRIDGF